MEELNRAYEALQKAHDAGDVEGAKQIAEYARTLETEIAAKPKADNYEQAPQDEGLGIPESSVGAAMGATLGAAAGPAVGSVIDTAANIGAKLINPAAAGTAGMPGSNSPAAVRAWLKTQTSNPEAGGRTMGEAYKKSELAAGKPIQSRGSNVPIRKGKLGITNQIPESTLSQKAAANLINAEKLGKPGVARRMAGMGVAGAELGNLIEEAKKGNVGRAALSGLGALGGAATQSRIKPLRAIGTGLSVAVPALQKFALPDEEDVQNKAAGGEVLKQLKKLNLADLEGKTILGTMSDRTKVGGGFKGGPMFPTVHEGAAWAMDAPGAATRLLKAMHGAGGPEKTVVAPMLMSPGAQRSNRDVSKMAVDQFQQNFQGGGFSPERLAEIESRIRSMPGLAEHPGMMDEGAQELMNNLTFAQRKQIVDALASKPKTAQALDLQKLLSETTEPGLQGAPLGAIGPSVFKLSGERSVNPELHGSYSHILHGEPVGSIEPIPREFLFRDLESKAMKELGRPLSDYNYRTSVGVPSQMIDEKLLRALQELGYLK